jgi:hypothetical protein
MNKLAHTLILVVFGIACFFLWSILWLASRSTFREALPPLTILCVGLRPVMILLPVLATAYCIWIWFRRADQLPSWVVFFAVTMSVLVLVTLPTLFAAYLPLIKELNHLIGPNK